MLTQWQVRKLTQEKRALQTQLLDYETVLDTLAGRLQRYEENLRFYALLAGSKNQDEASAGQEILEVEASGSLTARAARLQSLARDLQLRQEMMKKALQKKVREIAHLPIMLPVDGRLSSGFGMRADPFQIGGPDRQMHEGVDISTTAGTGIRATADGVVIFAGWSETYGNLVILDHRNGYYTYYAHCSELLVKRNQQVKRNDIIAWVGSTGRSTAPHVHYEVLKGKKAIDPREMLFDCIWG